ncbi:hypothetical protein KIPB_009522, partial [Kipferlia bialata]
IAVAERDAYKQRSDATTDIVQKALEQLEASKAQSLKQANRIEFLTVQLDTQKATSKKYRTDLEGTLGRQKELMELALQMDDLRKKDTIKRVQAEKQSMQLANLCRYLHKRLETVEVKVEKGTPTISSIVTTIAAETDALMDTRPGNMGVEGERER